MPADHEQTFAERPCPTIKRSCLRCLVEAWRLRGGWCVVSPTGLAHHGTSGGDTACGIDATGDKWWWPL